MKKKLYLLFCFLLPCFAYSQMRVVVNSTYIVLNGGTAATPVYVELNNPAPNAITDLNTSNGWIISESEFNMVKWDIGTNTGTYTVPFGYSTTDYIPLTYNIATAGAGANGTVKFSTYHGSNWDNISYIPSDVTNMDGVNMTDNSANVVDRFWIIDADSGYITKPASNITFTYIRNGVPSEIAAPNTINEPTLIAERFNDTSNVWGDWLGVTGTDATSVNTGTVSTGSVSPSDLFRSWTLANDSSPLYSLPPQVDFSSYDSVVCVGDSVKFINESHFYSPSTWNWTFAGGTPATSTLDSPTVVYYTPGTYLVKLVASNNNGSDSMVKISYITVKPRPTVTFSGTDTICQGDSTTINASGGTGYLWNTGDSTGTITVKPSSDSTFSVSVSNGGCTTDTSIRVIVNPLPIANTSGDTTICPGVTVPLNASGGTSYAWSPSSGLSASNSPNPTATPSVTTTYTVMVSNGICASEDSVTVSVNTPPSGSANGGTTISQGQSASLSAPAGAGYSYMWIPNTGLSCDTCQYTLASPAVTTTYTVVVTALGGCSATDTVTVIVKENCGSMYLPNAFSPNDDGYNDVLYVYGNCIQSMELNIYDRWGNKVFESDQQSIGWDGTYIGLPMNTGSYVYTLIVTDFNNNTTTKKGNVSLIR